jgi:hypothetical protein
MRRRNQVNTLPTCNIVRSYHPRHNNMMINLLTSRPKHDESTSTKPRDTNHRSTSISTYPISSKLMPPILSADLAYRSNNGTAWLPLPKAPGTRYPTKTNRSSSRHGSPENADRDQPSAQIYMISALTTIWKLTIMASAIVPNKPRAPPDRPTIPLRTISPRAIQAIDRPIAAATNFLLT